jgi:hypothetical protein
MPTASIKKMLELDPEQLTIFRYLYVAYVSAFNLAHGPIEADDLPKLHIRAERVATADLPVQEPHYFEPLSEDDWQRAGFELPTLLPGKPHPNDLSFCHAHSVISDIEMCLEDSPHSDGLGLSRESDWTYCS